MSEDRAILASGAYGLDPHLAQIFGADGGQTQPFRGLATELLVRHVDKGRRGLAVCGAASGAGVSMLAAGLALALAQVGVDTLIVDANLRQPSLEGLIIGGNSAKPGLLQYLQRQDVSLEDMTHDQVIPDLSLVYAGGQTAQPQELFDSERFRGLASACMRQHQLVIIDTPPFSRCAEARRIAAVTGYAVVVARNGASYARDVAALCSDLAIDGVEVVGSILNGASTERPAKRS